MAYRAPPRRLVRRAVRLPRPALRLLGGRPVVREGQLLDPHVQWLLRLLDLAGPKSTAESTVAEARATLRQTALLLAPEPPAAVTVTDLTVAGPVVDLPARLYRPPAPAPGPQPALVYYHGGGWTIGDLDTHDPVCRCLAADSGCAVLSVAYRLAPEHPFPAAVEDARAAFAWAVEHAPRLGLDPARLAVGGDSAGGTLATVTARLCRDEAAPGPALQLLVYPGTDCSRDAPSYETFREGFLFGRDDIHWFRRHYLQGPDDARDPRASPLLTEDLSGLPPACVQVAGFDPLRDEGLAYARRLEEAGVAVELQLFEGLVHGFLQLGAGVPAARRALREGALALRRGLAAGAVAPR